MPRPPKPGAADPDDPVAPSSAAASVRHNVNVDALGARESALRDVLAVCAGDVDDGDHIGQPDKRDQFEELFLRTYEM
jgi:hypothetical protein